MKYRTAPFSLRLFLLVVGVLTLASAEAETKLPSVLGDNMVLQRGEPVPVWGWDTPGQRVKVAVAGVEASVMADDNGKWKLSLPSMKAGGPHAMTIAGTRELTLENVLIGEVWLCSGQSNMEWTVGGSRNAKDEVAAANHSRIRHIKIPHRPSDKPESDVPSNGWQVCSPQTVGGFTAVGYFFARNLLEELDVPIGLIGSNWGGTRIEPWVPPVGFKKVPALADLAGKLDSFPTKNNQGVIQHQSPLALYNGMISPLLPYAIRGALWYQGESNNGEGMLYHEKMKALIHGWREVWGNDEMPFYFVQLAPFRYGGDPTRLPGIWEAQLATLSVPNTGMAVITDIGNVADIHPRNKQDVGKRLALWALARTYGKDGLVYSGPLYRSMEVEDGAIRLHFDHVGGGLVSRDGKPLTSFTIAGADGQFVEAEAKVDGDTVVVRAGSVGKPVAVRFGWHQEAEPNLSNKAGLPASPFRTDSK